MYNKKLNHTPDAIGDCMVFLPQTKQQSHSLQTTAPKRTKPHFDHLRLKPATALLSRGVRL